MSTSPSRAAAASQRQSKPQYSPISLLDTDLARVYTHIHPLTILSIYFLSFKLVVADPVSALASLLVPLIALQAVYVVVCLPPTGSHSVPGHGKTGAGAGAVGKKAGGGGKKDGLTLGMRVIPALISLLLSLTLGTPIILLIAILLGAPLTTHTPHTVLLSGHLSLLSITPLIYTRGIERSTWRAVIALLVPIDEVFGASLGACVGAWLGAVPIPLDWDREWQRWPVTVVTGGYVGWAVGKTIGGTVGRGRVVDLSP